MLKLSFLLFILCLSHSAHADIFKYLDDNGKLYITDRVLGQPYRLITKFIPYSKNHPSHQQNVHQYLPHINQAAKKHNIDPNLLQAIIDTESSFDPKARSKAGAIGLMQLMPETAKQLGVTDSWNPEQNIFGGALLFRQLLDTFNQNTRLSLAAYNAGAGAVRRAGNTIPNFPETQRYIKKVMQKYDALR